MASRKDVVRTMFGEFIRQKLAERGVSQADFARAIKLSPASVNKYLSGALIPTPDRVKAIAEYLEVSEKELEEHAQMQEADNQVVKRTSRNRFIVLPAPVVPCDMPVTVDDLNYLVKVSEGLPRPLSIAGVIELIRLRKGEYSGLPEAEE